MESQTEARLSPKLVLLTTAPWGAGESHETNGLIPSLWQMGKLTWGEESPWLRSLKVLFPAPSLLSWVYGVTSASRVPAKAAQILEQHIPRAFTYGEPGL